MVTSTLSCLFNSSLPCLLWILSPSWPSHELPTYVWSGNFLLQNCVLGLILLQPLSTEVRLMVYSYSFVCSHYSLHVFRPLAEECDYTSASSPSFWSPVYQTQPVNHDLLLPATTLWAWLRYPDIHLDNSSSSYGIQNTLEPQGNPKLHLWSEIVFVGFFPIRRNQKDTGAL